MNEKFDKLCETTLQGVKGDKEKQIVDKDPNEETILEEKNEGKEDDKEDDKKPEEPLMNSLGVREKKDASKKLKVAVWGGMTALSVAAIYLKSKR